MARKSQRLSSASGATPTHKRAASATALPGETTKKTKTQKATPTKSQYFESDTKNPSDEVMRDDEDDELSSAPADDASDFGLDSTSEDEDEDEDSYDDDEDAPKRSKKNATPRKIGSSTTATRGSEVWREGVKTGLGPGKEVIIKKPKARAAGKTPYADDTLHPNTLLFLADLKKNNDREWLKRNDPDFRQSEKDWFSFVEKLTEKLAEIDETIPELPVKDIIFRVYRDVRFSKDPTPYKPFFSAAWSRTGRKGPYAHYYVQISPNNGTFVGGGLWHPDAAPTAAMRRAIDRHPERLKGVLVESRLRKEFLEGAPNNETKAVKAFVAANKENALKTRPKGYDADHADIDLLRLRNYTIGRKLTDDELLTGGLDRVAELLGCMLPFITYLNSVVMPDEEEEDSAESEDGEQEQSDDDTGDSVA